MKVKMHLAKLPLRTQLQVSKNGSESYTLDKKGRPGLLPAARSHNTSYAPTTIGSQGSGTVLSIADTAGLSPTCQRPTFYNVRTGILQVDRRLALEVGKLARGTGRKDSVDFAG